MRTSRTRLLATARAILLIVLICGIGPGGAPEHAGRTAAGPSPRLSVDVFANEDDSPVALPRNAYLTGEQRNYLWGRDRDGQIPVLGLSSQRLRHELLDRGAAVTSMTLRLRFGVSGAAKARVTNIRPVGIKRARPYDGVLLAGEFSPYPLEPQADLDMSVDLDERTPTVRPVLGLGGGAAPPYFPSRSLLVERPMTTSPGAQRLRGKDEFVILLNLLHGSAEFDVKIDYTVAGIHKSVIMDNEGKHFRLTGYNCSGTGYGTYQHARISNGVPYVPGPVDYDSPQRVPISPYCT